ncbi:MAG TPA: acyl-CoA thioesterase [Pseudonocardiaceae bacterium]|nr:acyl-CoA thioesterase [Pseudonocardiaceae bacterium]
MTRDYVYSHLVTLDETNLVGNVYFAHYVRWQGHCRERFLADNAPGVLAGLDGGLTIVTTDCSCDYLDQLTANDKVELRMTLCDIDGGRIGMDFAYFRVNGDLPRLVARGRQSVACMTRGPTGLTATTLPEELRSALVPYLKNL